VAHRINKFPYSNLAASLSVSWDSVPSTGQRNPIATHSAEGRSAKRSVVCGRSGWQRAWQVAVHLARPVPAEAVAFRL